MIGANSGSVIGLLIVSATMIWPAITAASDELAPDDTLTTPETTIESPSPRTAAHRRLVKLLDEERYDEALAAAEQVVELTSSEFGSDSEPMIVPLTNLATTQVETGALADAETNYRNAIALIEQHAGFLSPRLVNPLIGLGSTYNRVGQYGQAVAAFERALRVNHVNSGFTNTDQLEIRDGLTESYIGLQETDEANFHQETQLEIHRRRFGSAATETAGAYKKLGDWYVRIGQVEPAQISYGRADRIYGRHGGDVLEERVNALMAFAELYKRMGQLGPGTNKLRRALTLIDEQSDRNLGLRGGVLVAMGDMYAYLGKPESAGRRYQEAWSNLTSDDDTLLEKRDAYFDRPVRIFGTPLSVLKRTDDVRSAPRDRIRDGYVLLGYSVSPTGRVRDIRIIESDPPGLMDARLNSAWQRSKFRPRFVDGEAVRTENLLLRHEFQYAIAPPKSDDSERAPRSKGDLEYPDKQT